METKTPSTRDSEPCTNILCSTSGINISIGTETKPETKPETNDSDDSLSSSQGYFYNLLCDGDDAEINRSDVKHKKKHKKCSKHCRKKHCKYCRILSSSPHYLGAQCIVSNDIKVNELTSRTCKISRLVLKGQEIYPESVRVRQADKYYINDNITTRSFRLYKNNYLVSLDNLLYKNDKPSPSGTILRTIHVSDYMATSLQEIMFKPTFKNSKSEQVQISHYRFI